MARRLPDWHSVASTAAERVKKHRDKRRAEGKCAFHGCPKLTGESYFCVKHGEAHAARMKAARSTPEACAEEWPTSKPRGEWP